MGEEEFGGCTVDVAEGHDTAGCGDSQRGICGGSANTASG